MHQTRKGNQWIFGLRAHIGVDAKTGLVHSAVSMAASKADVLKVGALLHGREKAVFGDASNGGANKRASKRGRRFYIAEQRRKVKATTDAVLSELTRKIERAKASIRAKGEHPIRIIKR